jgi:glycosyltransferase involved in cell wall biosynthesis
MREFVSAIVPVFNNAAGIRNVLNALIAQSYPRRLYEIVVADNGSIDGTQKLVKQYCEAYPNLVRMVVEDKMQSSYAARNKGLRLACGEILAFLDSDCIPETHWIESGVMGLLEGPAACGGGALVFVFRSEQPNIYESFDSVRKLNQRVYIEKAGFAATANFFIRRELFEEYGLFRSDLISGGDYEFGRRLTKAGEKMIFMPKAVVRHPARATFSAILKKSKRIALGQKQLQEMGLLEHGRLSWSSLNPERRCPELDGVALTARQRVGLVILMNFFKYYNLVKRL